MSVKSFLVQSTILLTALFGVSCGALGQYSELVIFGDSLSDTGNIAGAITPNLPAPYFQNRISNGFLAVDVIAEAQALSASAAAEGGSNFAIVGANILGDDIGDLSSQVDRFLERKNGAADSNALYLIFAGGNDLRDLRSESNELVAQQQLEAISAMLVTQLQRLLNAGARTFLIANVADIGRIPQTLDLENQSPGISARTTLYVQRFNELLNSQLQAMSRQAEVKIFDFDVFSELQSILDNPSAFGFSVADTGCFDPGDGFNIFEFQFDARCDSGLFPLLPPDFSGFVFFDSIHPTAATHRIIGQAAIQRLALAPMGAKKPALTGVLLLLLE